MPTLEEILGIDSTTDVLVVDQNLRTIKIPSTVKNIGVESDDDVLRLKFAIPRYYGEFDLSEFDIRINYLNAKSEGDVYEVKDATETDDDHITFTWLVGRFAVMYKGAVTFNICLKKLDDGIVVQEFNTTPTSLPVLQGLETMEQITQEYPDLLEAWRKQLFDTHELNMDAINMAIAAAKDEITEHSKQVSQDMTDSVNEFKEWFLDANSSAFRTLNGSSVVPEGCLEEPLIGLSVYGSANENGDSITEDVNVTFGGKNLLVITAESTDNFHGIDYQINDDGTVTANQSGSPDTVYFVLGTVDLKAGEYILSGWPSDKETAFNGSCLSITAPDVPDYRDYIYCGGLGNCPDVYVPNRERSFTVLKDMTVEVYIALNDWDYPIADMVFSPMLRPASITDNTFEKGVPSQTFTVGVDDYMADAGDVADEKNYELGKFIRRVGKIELNGDSELSAVANSVGDGYKFVYSGTQGLAKPETMNIKTVYDAKTPDEIDTKNSGICVLADGSLAIYDSEYDSSDISAFKASLTETPIVVYYELDEYVYSDIDPDELQKYYDIILNPQMSLISNSANTNMTVSYGLTEVAAIISKNNRKVQNMTDKVSLPEDDAGDIDNGDLGQIAVSDGNGGIEWIDNDKVSLPKDGEGNIDNGASGQIAVSDGNGGIEWSDDNNVNLPKDDEGNVNNGTAGQIAISDGKGGIDWTSSVDETLTNISIRYNETIDSIELLIDGEWRVWSSAYMSGLDLLALTTDDWTTVDEDGQWGSALNTFEASPLHFQATGDSDGTVDHLYATTDTAFDLTLFTELRVVGEVYLSKFNAEALIQLVKSDDNSVITLYHLLNSTNPVAEIKTPLDEHLDVSELSGHYYVRLNLGVQSGGVSSIKADKLLFAITHASSEAITDGNEVKF